MFLKNEMKRNDIVIHVLLRNLSNLLPKQLSDFKLEWKNANLISDIVRGILKSFVSSYIYMVTKILSTLLERLCFPNQRKLLEVRKENTLEEEIYRHVRVLSQISKILKKIVFKQMNLFFLPLLTGSHKNNSTQNSLLNMINK